VTGPRFAWDWARVNAHCHWCDKPITGLYTLAKPDDQPPTSIKYCSAACLREAVQWAANHP
jgi:hypothetical protein